MPFRGPDGTSLVSIPFLGFLAAVLGRGEDARGGGVAVRWVIFSGRAGGVGMGGGPVTPLGCDFRLSKIVRKSKPRFDYYKILTRVWNTIWAHYRRGRLCMVSSILRSMGVSRTATW